MIIDLKVHGVRAVVVVAPEEKSDQFKIDVYTVEAITDPDLKDKIKGSVPEYLKAIPIVENLTSQEELELMTNDSRK